MTNRIASDDEIRHKFNLLLSNGIKVRRHEKYKFAEVVTLFGEWIKDVSSNNEQSDCLSKIIWEPEVNIFFFFFNIYSFFLKKIIIIIILKILKIIGIISY